MSVKPKIAIVAGEWCIPRFLKLFEPLRDAYDPCIYVLHNERLIDRHGTGIKLRIFDNIPDMPGYMQGLEEELASVSAILAIETSKLATFQAVRAARKFGVPLGVVSNEFLPYFYDKFANIRAIQFDICNKADRFWATSQLAAAALKLDQVPAASIRIVPPVVDTLRFKPDAVARARFRKYIGIDESETVLLFHQELDHAYRPDDVLKAVALLGSRGHMRARPVRLLFCGSGAAAMELKYKSYDLGLGKAVMFLHQDPEPFLSDLYASTDIMVVPRPKMMEFHEDLPLSLLEAMACGVAPVVSAGSIAAELAGEAASAFGDDSHLGLAAAMTPLVIDPEHLKAMKRRAVRKVQLDHSIESVRALVTEEVQTLLNGRMHRFDLPQNIPALRDAIDEALKRGEHRQVIERCEEALLLNIPSATDRAALFCRKGEAFYALGDIENAGNAFTESLKLSDRDFRTLKGLGYVAWVGHANEEALLFFKKAHSLRDDELEVMLGLGLVYRRLGLLEEAIFWLEKCLASDQHPPTAVSALAQACAQTPRVEHGIAVLERALESAPEHKILMMTLGQMYLNHGRASEGHALLKKALGDDLSTKAS